MFIKWLIGDNSLVPQSVFCPNNVHAFEIFEEKLFLSQPNSGDIRMWNLNELKEIKTLIGHKLKVNCFGFLKPNQLVTGGADWRLIVWDVLSGQKVNVLEYHQYPITAIGVSYEFIIAGDDRG